MQDPRTALPLPPGVWPSAPEPSPGRRGLCTLSAAPREVAASRACHHLARVLSLLPRPFAETLRVVRSPGTRPLVPSVGLAQA